MADYQFSEETVEKVAKALMGALLLYRSEAMDGARAALSVLSPEVGRLVEALRSAPDVPVGMLSTDDGMAAFRCRVEVWHRDYMKWQFGPQTDALRSALATAGQQQEDGGGK